MLFENYGPVGLVAVPLVGLICGVFNGVLFAYARLPSFLVTLGTLFMFDGFSLILSDGRPRPVSTRTFDTAFNGTLFGFLPIVTLWAVAILLLAIFIASRTRFGRYLYAIGGGEKVARLSGVAIERQKFLAFVLSGFLGGFAALLLIFRLQAATTGMGASCCPAPAFSRSMAISQPQRRTSCQAVRWKARELSVLPRMPAQSRPVKRPAAFKG